MIFFKIKFNFWWYLESWFSGHPTAYKKLSSLRFRREKKHHNHHCHPHYHHHHNHHHPCLFWALQKVQNRFRKHFSNEDLYNTILQKSWFKNFIFSVYSGPISNFKTSNWVEFDFQSICKHYRYLWRKKYALFKHQLIEKCCIKISSVMHLS